MGNLSKTMSGTPWHVEHYERKEGDERRHNHRCRYYVKSDKSCMKRNMKCIGSAHCMDYIEATSDAPIPKTTPNEVSYTLSPNSTHQNVYNNIIYLSFSEIKVESFYKECVISTDSLNSSIKYFQKNKQLKCPLYVKNYKGFYLLADNYIQYLTAQKVGLTNVPVFMGDYNIYDPYEQFCHKNCKIQHKKYGKGKIIKHDYKYIWVEFSNQKVIKLDSILCLKNKLIKISQ